MNDKTRMVWEFLADTQGFLRIAPLQEAGTFSHHGATNTIQSHCIRTAWCVFRLCRLFSVKRLHEISAVQAALVHDLTGYSWSTNRWQGKCRLNRQRIKHAAVHGRAACCNISHYVWLNERQKDAVIKHMFPLYPIPPKYVEGWLLTTADKIVALKECGLCILSRFGYTPKPPLVLRAANL